jgi:membrane protein YqaA with SNARE-associated domain
MGRFVAWIEAVAFSLGAPGLFFVAFLDSSFLSLPEINDILLVWMVTRHNERMIAYASAATLGSLAGCLTLYYIGRTGGEAFIRRRFSAQAIDRSLAAFRRYGLMAVLVPSLLPPPAPFKIFVLLAGIAGIKVSRFAIAIVIGRGIRYFGAGLLALWYGEEALEFIRSHGRTVALVLVVLLVVGFVVYLWRRRSSVQGTQADRVI